ncbi:hypothetical protein RF11_11301 [Thelohanellus kitauei]|uniref:SH2 domain-containing protein n=1 Tax=Thelohanellus kitauei TaxID=669202 RepID=A0A0C2MHR7_THEKT|nr:hypothetical protein RF11_11301 [Thelohanellus kitauei]
MTSFNRLRQTHGKSKVPAECEFSNREWKPGMCSSEQKMWVIFGLGGSDLVDQGEVYRCNYRATQYKDWVKRTMHVRLVSKEQAADVLTQYEFNGKYLLRKEKPKLRDWCLSIRDKFRGINRFKIKKIDEDHDASTNQKNAFQIVQELSKTHRKKNDSCVVVFSNTESRFMFHQCHVIDRDIL